MYAILAEDSSDAETLRVLVRRLAGNPKLPIKSKDFDGCSALLRKASRELELFHRLGCRRFVVCADSDSHDPGPRLKELEEAVHGCGVAPVCLVVPVQELEAWILADVQAVRKVITSWIDDKALDFPNPEGIKDPKEHLERTIRNKTARPPYSHATHNPRVADHLNLEQLKRKCPSFRRLADFVTEAA